MTKWNFLKSYKYEALCLLNLLNDDPYFEELYVDEKRHWKNLLGEGTKKDIYQIYKEIKIEGEQAISSVLTYYLSTVECDDTAGIVEALEKKLEIIFSKSSSIENWNELNWDRFCRIVPPLINYFTELEKLNFRNYLDQEIFPGIDREIDAVQASFNKKPKDVIGELTQFLNRDFDENINIFLVHFSRPLGIRLHGNSLVAIAGMPIELSAYITIHEMIHTPYEMNNIFSEYFTKLPNDTFFKSIYEKRNLDYGYNTISDYFDENATRAADHYMAEKFGIFPEIDHLISGNFRKRFAKQDEGMHILSPIIYYYLEKDFGSFNGDYQMFLEKLIKNTIAPGQIEREYKIIMDGYPERSNINDTKTERREF